jgi:BlaI family transcriptional regulator, penicillinase repressor
MVERNIPPAEMDVLACLQRLEQATVRQIRECMHAYRPMEHASVVNLLKRLESKSLVARRKGTVGKAFVYSPTRAAGAFPRNILRRLVDRAFGGDSMALVASLFETNPPAPHELARLEQLLNELKQRKRKKE